MGLRNKEDRLSIERTVQRYKLINSVTVESGRAGPLNVKNFR